MPTTHSKYFLLLVNDYSKGVISFCTHTTPYSTLQVFSFKVYSYIFTKVCNTLQYAYILIYNCNNWQLGLANIKYQQRLLFEVAVHEGLMWVGRVTT